MTIVETMTKAKADKDAAKGLYIGMKDSVILKKIVWLAYGGGKDKLNVPTGLPPAEVLGEQWNDASLEYAIRDLQMYMTEEKAPAAVEKAWIKLFKSMSTEEAKILAAATEGDMSQWNLDYDMALSIYGDEKIGDIPLVMSKSKSKKADKADKAE